MISDGVSKHECNSTLSDEDDFILVSRNTSVMPCWGFTLFDLWVIGAMTLIVTWRHHAVGPMIVSDDTLMIQTYHSNLDYFRLMTYSIYNSLC
jgi:hypothetical protein